MSRTRAISVGLLCAVAGCAIMVPSASAHSYIIEGNEIAPGKIVGTEAWSVAPSRLTVENQVTSECESAKALGSIEEGGKSSAYVLPSNCKVLNDPTCKIEPVGYRTKGELVVYKEHLAVKTRPFEGNVYVTQKLEGCTGELREDNGRWELLGTQYLEMVEPGVEKTVHEFVARPTESFLKVRRVGGSTYSAVGEARGATRLERWVGNTRVCPLHSSDAWPTPAPDPEGELLCQKWSAR
jgi:hypothetical protein